MRDVIIIGAGPVGLFLGNCLAQRGLDFAIFERDATPSEHSRAIGIHPPSLACFESLDLVDAFLERGARITSGRAFGSSRNPLGTLRFDGRFPFVLSLKQTVTNEILEAPIASRVRRGFEVGGFKLEEEGVQVFLEDGTVARARYLVACDGARSRIRERAKMGWIGGPYPDTYVMGDFAQEDGAPDAADIYLHRDGLVESFPLSDGGRRWVLKTDQFIEEAVQNALMQEVERRSGVTLDPAGCSMVNAFGIQHYLARRLVRRRVILAGDAAHVMSPIGGQGMNVGWLNAAVLAEALDMHAPDFGNHRRADSHDRDFHAGEALHAYALTARKRARRAISRAAWYTRLGRRTRLAPARNSAMALALHSPFRRRLARTFSMHGL